MMMGIANAIAAAQKATSVLECLLNAPEDPSCTSDRRERAVAHAASSQSTKGATGPEVTGKEKTIQTGFKRRPAKDGGGKPSPGAARPSKRSLTALTTKQVLQKLGALGPEKFLNS
jgi:hypothetical protein